MKIKVLCITVLIFTVLIFGANHYAARNDFQDIDYANCPECDCKVTMYAASARKGVKIPVNPSCSVKFYVQHKEGENSGYRMLPPEEKERKFKACYFEVHCDESKEAYFDCGSAGSQVAVLQSHMCWGL